MLDLAQRRGVAVICAVAGLACVPLRPPLQAPPGTSVFAELRGGDVVTGDVCAAPDGGVYAVTLRDGELAIVKLGADGVEAWSRAVRAPGRITRHEVACSRSGVTIATHGDSRACNGAVRELVPGRITRFAPDGQARWTVDLGAPDEQIWIHAIAEGADGRTWVGGQVQVCQRGIRKRALLVRIDERGQLATLRVPIEGAEEIAHLDVAGDGVVVVASGRGVFVSAIDANGRSRWSREGRELSLLIYGMTTGERGDVYLCGMAPDGGDRRFRLARLDEDGRSSWTQALPGGPPELFGTCLRKRKATDGAIAANDARENVLAVRTVSRDGVGETVLELPYPGDYAPTLDATGEPEALFLGIRPWALGTRAGEVRPYVLRAPLEPTR